MLRGSGFSRSGSGIRAALLVAGASVGLTYDASATSLFPFQTIALSGQVAPGMPAGATWGPVGVARLNADAQAIFLGRVLGGGTTAANDGGIWTRSATGVYTLLAREGDPAPGAPGGTLYGDLEIDGDDALHLNDAGDVAVRTGLTGGASAQGIFGPDGLGGLTLLARDGASAPGAGAGVDFGSLSFASPIVGPSGSTLFSSELTGIVSPSNDTAIFRSIDGSVSLLHREGDSAPGTSDTFGSLLPTPVFNQNGLYAFETELQSSGDAVLFGPDTGGALALRVRANDLLNYPAPGTPPGATFTEFGIYGMNEAGRIAFTASVSGAVGNEGLFTSDSNGTLASVARADELVPGGAPGETYDNLTTFSLNEDGDLSFASFLAGIGVDDTNDKALFFFSEDTSTVTMRARGGDTVTGLPTDILLDEVYDQSLNLLDDIVFAGTLQGTAVDAGNDDALFYSAPDGGLLLVLREGDGFEVAPGDTRIILAFDVADAIFAERSQESLNDARQLVVSIDFDDGSEWVFLFAVPEPGSGALLALGLLGVAGRARRRDEARKGRGVMNRFLVFAFALLGWIGASPSWAQYDVMDCTADVGDPEPGTPEWNMADQNNQWCAWERQRVMLTNPAFTAAHVANASNNTVAASDPFREPATRWDGIRGQFKVVEYTDPRGYVNAGYLFAPLDAARGSLPGVLLMPCNIGEAPQLGGVWWAMETTAEHGYLVFCGDIDLADVLPPVVAGVPPYDDALRGVDAADYFLATPDHPNEHGEYNPWWELLDRSRPLGIMGHSGGGSLALAAANRDPKRRFGAVVAFDPSGAAGIPSDYADQIYVPSMIQVADYDGANGYTESTPERPVAAPGSKRTFYETFVSEGVDTMQVAFRSSTHVDWAAALTAAFGSSLYGEQVIVYYTLAWFDRYLSADPAVRAEALARLTAPATSTFDDSSDLHSIGTGTFDATRIPVGGTIEDGNVPLTIEGRFTLHNRLSWWWPTRYSIHDDGGQLLHCEDVRSGCAPAPPAPAAPAAQGSGVTPPGGPLLPGL